MSEPPRPDDDQERPHDDHPLRRVTLRAFEGLIDQHVHAAEAAGQFQNLPGAGKPLQLDSDDHVPEDLRVGFRMLKNAGFAPPWVDLQRSIREQQDGLDRWLAQQNRRWAGLSQADRERLRAEHAQRLGELNKQIMNYNLTAPPVAGQLPLLQPWREQRKLGAE
jgi:hypothetical protein